MAPDTDVYGLGTTIFELLAGRLPYSEEGDVMAVLYRHVHEDPLPLAQANPAVPAQVRDAVMRAIARDRQDRYQTAHEFGGALAEASVECWGSEWLSRVEPAVPAGGPVDGLVQRAIATPRSSPAASGQARGITGALGRRSLRRRGKAPAVVDEPKREVAPETPVPRVAAEAPEPEEPSRKRRMWALALVLALVLGVFGAVVIAGGGDGGDSGDSGDGATELCEDGSAPVDGECPEPRHCEDGSHAVDGKCPEDEASSQETTPEEPAREETTVP
ncbi:MAG TPA: hypothetical protein VHE80_09460 [Acidimicrobiales bacterium]|nr:hypothetical protein [Acidimicrobiales bacterium]